MTESDQSELIRIAARAVRAEIENLPRPPVSAVNHPQLENNGAFVTLRARDRLRGCVGTFEPDGPLAQTIADMAAAAARDPRFRDDPLTLAEWADLEIELSLLSPRVPMRNVAELEIGRHGIYVRAGVNKGCFLPQVAVEAGWNAETFLTQCCLHKANLPFDAWRDDATEVSFFTVHHVCAHARRLHHGRPD
jgi:AmmeMemoRadiSam system protein A